MSKCLFLKKLKSINKKQIVVAFGAVLVIGTMFFGYQYNKRNHEEFSWSIDGVGSTDTNEPITKITLLGGSGGKVYFSDTLPGECTEIDKVNLDINEVSRVQCDLYTNEIFSLFKDGDFFVLKSKFIDERGGPLVTRAKIVLQPELYYLHNNDPWLIPLPELKKRITDYMSIYKPEAVNEESLNKFNSEFIVYEKRSLEDTGFIDEVVGWGVEKWGPCFGIPEGNCRE